MQKIIEINPELASEFFILLQSKRAQEVLLKVIVSTEVFDSDLYEKEKANFFEIQLQYNLLLDQIFNEYFSEELEVYNRNNLFYTIDCFKNTIKLQTVDSYFGNSKECKVCE